MLGWGVLGCGDITDKRGAPAINAQADSRLVSFQSRTGAQAADFARRHGAPRWTTSRKELLADPEIGAVYVATEHHRHCEDAVAAAEAGKHVLCEKPMAMSVAECRRMIEACRAGGVALQIAYYRRYYPKLVRMKELLDAGAIGEPVTAHIHLASRLNKASIDPGTWRLNAALSGGGQLVDTGSHRLDLLCWLLGEPDRVAAFAECREMPIEAPDMETLLVRMRSGVHVTTRHGFRTRSGDEFEIVGTEGTLSATPVDGPTLRLLGGNLDAAAGALAPTLKADLRQGADQAWEVPKHENVHFPLFDDFARRVTAAQPPRFTGEDGMQTTRIIDAAYESARSGRVVKA
jgi:1,5-anhydro-D-fructose reductase (1,5-anhydro-D-mannitol-forming)